jgi:glycosyltransferase involved in cell wall biosynthesis
LRCSSLRIDDDHGLPDGVPEWHYRPDTVLSVVTINRNNREGLERTLTSLEQFAGALPYEVIVVDGDSTDGSLELARSRPDMVAHLIVGAVDGITASWNAALEEATGGQVMIMNAGDWLASGSAVQVANAIRELDHGVVVADVEVVSTSGVIRTVIPDFTKPAWKGMGFLHPGTVASSTVFEEVGRFDPRYELAADCDWFLRCRAAGIPLSRGGFTVCMEADGVSVVRRKEAHAEYVQALAANGATRLQLYGARAAGTLLRWRDRIRR